MGNLSAYIDESGNSGIKIFQGNDKFHWVGVMLTSQDAEPAKERINQLVSQVGFNELHGGELGLTRINQIAKGLVSIYNELNVEFVFTRVEREHIASMKFVDLVFDNANNKAKR